MHHDEVGLDAQLLKRQDALFDVSEVLGVEPVLVEVIAALIAGIIVVVCK